MPPCFSWSWVVKLLLRRTSEGAAGPIEQEHGTDSQKAIEDHANKQEVCCPRTLPSPPTIPDPYMSIMAHKIPYHRTHFYFDRIMEYVPLLPFGATNLNKCRREQVRARPGLACAWAMHSIDRIPLRRAREARRGSGGMHAWRLEGIMHLRVSDPAGHSQSHSHRCGFISGRCLFLGARVTQARTMGRRIIMDERTQSSSRGRTGEPCAVSKVVAAANGTPHPHGRVLHVYTSITSSVLAS
jgi:hypothetical protein